MQKLIPMLLLLITSCVAVKTNDHSWKQLGKENTAQLLIVKTDGTKTFPTSIKYPNYGALKLDDEFLKVDGQKVFYREMNAFQDENGYYVILRNNTYKSGKLLTRIRTGKINLYAAPNVDFTEYFFDKNGSKPEKITYETFNGVVADNQEAFSLFLKLFPKKIVPNDTDGGFLSSDGSRANLTRIIDLYNR